MVAVVLCRIDVLVWKPVEAQSVITNIQQDFFCLFLIGEFHAPATEQLYLFFYGGRGFH